MPSLCIAGCQVRHPVCEVLSFLSQLPCVCMLAARKRKAINRLFPLEKAHARFADNLAVVGTSPVGVQHQLVDGALHH